MKNLFRLVFILISISVISCTDDPIVENEQVSLAGHWKLVTYENHETNNVIIQSESDYDDIYVSFNEADDNNDFYISTKMGVQHGYYMYQSDSSVSLEDLFTMLHCMTGVYLPSFLWHQTILYVFENNTIYNFELEDNELRIYYEDNMKSILLELQD